MVRSAFCEGDVEAKIGVLIAVTVISCLSVILVCLYAMFYIRRRKMVCEQRLFEASEREIVAYQDVNLIVTYMAILQLSGVKLEPSATPSDKTLLPKMDTPQHRRRLMKDQKLDATRKKILDGIVAFYGYDPVVERPVGGDRDRSSKRNYPKPRLSSKVESASTGAGSSTSSRNVP